MRDGSSLGCRPVDSLPGTQIDVAILSLCSGYDQVRRQGVLGVSRIGMQSGNPVSGWIEDIGSTRNIGHPNQSVRCGERGKNIGRPEALGLACPTEQGKHCVLREIMEAHARICSGPQQTAAISIKGKDKVVRQAACARCVMANIPGMAIGGVKDDDSPLTPEPQLARLSLRESAKWKPFQFRRQCLPDQLDRLTRMGNEIGSLISGSHPDPAITRLKQPEDHGLFRFTALYRHRRKMRCVILLA